MKGKHPIKIYRGKKADFSIQTIIVIILCLVILIIMIMIFRNQVGSAISKFMGVENDVIKPDQVKDVNNYLFPSKDQPADPASSPGAKNAPTN